jgi:hypothetical protein
LRDGLADAWGLGDAERENISVVWRQIKEDEAERGPAIFDGMIHPRSVTSNGQTQVKGAGGDAEGGGGGRAEAMRLGLQERVTPHVDAEREQVWESEALGGSRLHNIRVTE